MWQLKIYIDNNEYCMVYNTTIMDISEFGFGFAELAFGSVRISDFFWEEILQIVR